MPAFALDTLRVYTLAEAMSDLVWDAVTKWPAFARRTTGDQLVRAADSVGANIAEGYRRASPMDNRRFVRMARGSLYELRHFLRRADRRRLLSKEQKAAMRSVLNELLPALNGYLRSLGTHGEKAGLGGPND